MVEKKILKTAFSKCFTDTGYKKRGQLLYRDGKEVYIAVDLQKSNYDDFYYFNIGFLLKALGNHEYPAANKCHMNYRAENLFPAYQELIYRGLLLSDGTQEWLSDLIVVVKNEIIPALFTCAEINGLRDFLSKGSMNNGLITKEAREFLL